MNSEYPKEIPGGMSRLFSRPDNEYLKIMAEFPTFLEKVWPLQKKHRERLPKDISALSKSLTANRGEINKNYWSKAQNISAYLYYFLPWNLIRIGALLNNLPLDTPKADARLPLLIDCGSGPLTFLLALWMAKRQWRNLPLNFAAVDKIAKPMELGKKLFLRIVEFTGGSPWDVKLLAGSLYNIPETIGTAYDHGKFSSYLVSCINVLNEPAVLSLKKAGNQEQYAPQNEELNERAVSLLSAWHKLWADSCTKILFMEPGTRLGGSIVMSLKKAAGEFGFHPLSPCLSSSGCPLSGKGGERFYEKRWCHFSFPADWAPDWLKKLSLEAGLQKEFLHLSPLLLGNYENQDGKAPSIGKARIVSGNFALQDKNKRFCYACSSSGLILLENKGNLMPGAAVSLKNYQMAGADRKSRAAIMVCKKR